MVVFKCKVCGDIYKKTMSVSDRIVDGICSDRCLQVFMTKDKENEVQGAPLIDIPPGLNGPSEHERV